LIYKYSTNALSFVDYTALGVTNDVVVLAVVWPNYNRVSVLGGFEYSVNGSPFGINYSYKNDLVFSETLDRLLFPSNIYLFKDDKLPIYKSKLISQNNLQQQCKLAFWWEDANSLPTYEYFEEDYQVDAAKLAGISTAKIAVKQYENKTKFYYKQATINIKDPSTVSGTKNFLLIGDSIANRGCAPYTKAVLDAKLTSATIVSLGTIADSVDGTKRCEGRGSWSIDHLIGRSTKFGATEIVVSYANPSDAAKNPFLFKCFTGSGGGGTKNADADGRYMTDLYPTWCFQHTTGGTYGAELDFTSGDTTKDYYVFDFKNYLTQCSIANPDVITICFGQNDLTDVLPLPLTIIKAQIRQWNATVKIGIAPLHGYSQVQSALGWETTAQLWIEAIMKWVEAAGDANLKVLPTWIHINYDFCWLLSTATAIDATSTAMKVTPTDGIHPDTRGMREMARAYAAFIANCF
jgi:lysophospholipase L1-like esterase